MEPDENSPQSDAYAEGLGKRIVIFGISGASWTEIDPLLQSGRLPAIKSLIASGVRARLMSTRTEGDKHFRPQIAWTTIATGVEPAKHGVTRFFHDADDIGVPTIWQRFQQSGRKVGLFGWPISWPVRPVNGFLIPAYDGRDFATWPSNYSFIRTLDRRAAAALSGQTIPGNIPLMESFATLEKLVRGGVRASTLLRLLVSIADIYMLAPNELRPLLHRRAKLEISVDMFVRLYRRHMPHFAAFVTFLVDYTEHRFWIFQEAEKFADAPMRIAPRLARAVSDSYVAVDRALGRILSRVDPETIVVLLSEHGMAIEPTSAEIGPWHWVLRPGQIKKLVGIDDPRIRAVPVARWIAFWPPHDQLATVAARLRNVVVKQTGLPLFQVDVHRDEVIVKFALWRQDMPGREELESLQIQYNNLVIPFTEIAQRFGRRRSAMHAEDGVLILAGPSVRHADIGTARLIDVAPTILRATGLTLAGLDGRVLNVF
jgi:Type I phosphodiesterase / nucleotide pyrophosphatase